MRDGFTAWKEDLSAAWVSFLALLYLLPLNSDLLARAGVPFSSAYTATVLSMAGGAFLLGRFGNCALVAGPSVACNIYLSYILVVSQGATWAEAMGITLLASLLLWLLLWRGWHRAWLEALPVSLRAAMRAGMGLWLVVNGLEQGHLIVPSTLTLTMGGDLADPVAFLTLWGLMMVWGFLLAGSRLAIFWGLLAVLAGACVLNLPDWPAAPFAIPDYPVQLGALSWEGAVTNPGVVLLVMLFMLTESYLPLEAWHSGEAASAELKLVAAAGVLAAVLGAGAVAVEPASLTGVRDNKGHGPLLVVALLLAMLFCAPLAVELAECGYLVAPALLVTGFYLVREIRLVEWEHLPSGFASLLLFLFIPLAGLLNGVAFGFGAYCLLQLLAGEGRNVKPALYGMALVLVGQLMIYAL